MDSIRKIVSSHNISLGFVGNGKQQSSSGKTAESSVWSDYISTPLKHFLLKHFQKSEGVQSGELLAGNVKVVAIKLNGKPEAGKEMILNFKLKAGDNSLKLLEGERLAFNLENWEQPAYLLFQADPKLNSPTDASFKGTSGNIHLAWSITFVILAILFVIFSLYHRFILPYPPTDGKVLKGEESILGAFFKTFASFFKRKEIWVILSFLMFYRLGEAQLIKIASPFMLDSRQLGGLGLTTGGGPPMAPSDSCLTAGGYRWTGCFLRFQVLVVVDGTRHQYFCLLHGYAQPSNYFVIVYGSYRTVQLRFWIYCLHAVHDLYI